ncbi:MAG: DUF2969 domain-containing protein [Lactobacillus sp.]|nr:DUF2969 domain-containing protein [Lactobacillus sp.]
MSKKPENINVEINEVKNRENPTWEVVIPHKKTIGLIEKLSGRYRATSTKNSSILYAKSLESSINDLLSYYVLHEK